MTSADRPVLVSNLVVGGLLLAVLAFLAWPLAVLGAAYVLAASAVLALRQEMAAYVVSWLAAVALWTWVLTWVDQTMSVGAASYGLLIGTLCFLVWQTLAFAVRNHWLGTHARL